jgi:hypothetical protein
MSIHQKEVELDWIDKGCKLEHEAAQIEPLASFGCLEILAEHIGYARIEKMLPPNSGEAYMNEPWAIPRLDRLLQTREGN